MSHSKLMLNGCLLWFVALIIFLTNPSENQNLLLTARYYSPPPQIQYFSFGEKLVLADSLWLRVIQDFDYCENKSYHLQCRNGWVYHMIDLVTDLDPHFYMPYIMGGTILSVLVDDTDGASKIFAKGVKYFPTEWSLSYRAGYHAMAEEKNLPKAAAYFQLAADNGAPWWLKSLAARLYSKVGQKDIARKVLLDLLATTKDEAQIIHIQERLSELDSSK